MPEANLFVPSTTIDPSKDYSQELIGEGKKYADVPAAARSIIEGQLHISRLESENAQMREDLSRRASIEEAIARLQKPTEPQSSQPNAGKTVDGGDDLSSRNIKPEDVTKLVNTAIAQRESERTAQSNVELVRETLAKEWGNDFTSKLETRAKELGLSKDQVTELAKVQPKVLLAAVFPQGPTAAAPALSVFSPSGAGVNTAGLATRTGTIPANETYKHWQQIRKDNPQYYHSVEGAKLRHENAMKHVEAFYT